MLVIGLTGAFVEPSGAAPAGPSLSATPHEGLSEGQHVVLTALGFFSLVSHGDTYTPYAYQCPDGLFPRQVIDPIDRAEADFLTLSKKCGQIGAFPVTGDASRPESPTSLTVGVHSTVVTGDGSTLHCGEVVDQCVLIAGGAARIADPGFAIASVPIGFASAMPQPPLGAPRSVVATAGDGTVTVSWLPPAADGGSPVIGYTVTPFIGVAQPSQTVLSAATTRTITGLVNGATYTFEVAAITAAGPGPLSRPSNAVVPAGPPGTPSIASVTAGWHEVTLTWTAPQTDGGNPIAAYLVTPYIGSIVQPTQRFGSPGTTQTLTGLTTGTRYSFRVAAVNAVGTGAPSPASATVAPK